MTAPDRLSTTDLTFSPDPWVWRRPRGGRVAHAIADGGWLPGFDQAAACGYVGRDWPAGGQYDNGRRCARCARRVGGIP